MGAATRVIRRAGIRLRLLGGGSRHALVGEEAQWEFKREFQIDFLRRHGLRPENVFLDIGCGTLRGGIPVIDFLEVGNYLGVDVRPNVIAQARKELVDAGLAMKQPVLTVSDMNNFTTERPVDVVWAFSVLIHMEDAILASCLSTVARVLAPEGVFYANVNVGDGRTGEWQGFPVNQRGRSFYELQAESVGLVVDDIGSLADVGHISGKPRQDAQRMLRFSRRT